LKTETAISVAIADRKYGFKHLEDYFVCQMEQIEKQRDSVFESAEKDFYNFDCSSAGTAMMIFMKIKTLIALTAMLNCFQSQIHRNCYFDFSQYQKMPILHR